MSVRPVTVPVYPPMNPVAPVSGSTRFASIFGMSLKGLVCGLWKLKSFRLPFRILLTIVLRVTSTAMSFLSARVKNAC
jgi:hypothetical protein